MDWLLRIYSFLETLIYNYGFFAGIVIFVGVAIMGVMLLMYFGIGDDDGGDLRE